MLIKLRKGCYKLRFYNHKEIFKNDIMHLSAIMGIKKGLLSQLTIEVTTSYLC